MIPDSVIPMCPVKDAMLLRNLSQKHWNASRNFKVQRATIAFSKVPGPCHGLQFLQPLPHEAMLPYNVAIAKME